MDFSNPPEHYWHCSVLISGTKRHSVANDLAFEELQRTILDPWLNNRPFVVSGKVIRSAAQVNEIKIAYTPQPQVHYAQAHNARMESKWYRRYGN